MTSTQRRALHLAFAPEFSAVGLSHDHVTWDVLGNLGAIICEHASFSDLFLSLSTRGCPEKRQRDLFPLGTLSCDELAAYMDLDSRSAGGALKYVNAVILVLNHLYGVKATDNAIASKRLTEAQRASLQGILRDVHSLHARLSSTVSSRTGDG